MWRERPLSVVVRCVTDIDVTRDGPRATVTIRNPERRNAIDTAACEQLAGRLRSLAAADDVRVLVLRGAGEHFCSGIDLAGAPAGTDPDRGGGPRDRRGCGRGRRDGL
jgi:enoyl-CoA hydratase/carnithine racemase